MKHIKLDYSLNLPLGALKGWGSGQNSTFSDYGNVVYQIKGNEACSSMVANSCM